MGLLDELRHKAAHSGRLCAFGKWLRDATPEDFTDLQTALADPSIATRWIVEALQLRGLPGNDSHLAECVSNHRKGICVSCPKAVLNVTP